MLLNLVTAVIVQQVGITISITADVFGNKESINAIWWSPEFFQVGPDTSDLNKEDDSNNG